MRIRPSWSPCVLLLGITVSLLPTRSGGMTFAEDVTAEDIAAEDRPSGRSHVGDAAEDQRRTDVPPMADISPVGVGPTGRASSDRDEPMFRDPREISSESELPGIENPFPDSGYDHPHDPVRVDSRPIIERIKLSVARPRRLQFTADGTLYIADQEAGTVLRRTSSGEVTRIADGLPEPTGLAIDPLGVLYVCCYAEGISNEGTVYRLSPEGQAELFVTGLSGPMDIAFDPTGNLLIANQRANNIISIAPNHNRVVLHERILQPTAISVDTDGTIAVLSGGTGDLLRIDPMGELQRLARGLDEPADLSFDERGHLIVTMFGTGELLYFDTYGSARPFATGPRGTIGHAIDPDGNVWLANWNHRFVMKITRNLSIRCPHCDRVIPLLLRPTPKPTMSTETSL